MQRKENNLESSHYVCVCIYIYVQRHLICHLFVFPGMAEIPDVHSPSALSPLDFAFCLSLSLAENMARVNSFSTLRRQRRQPEALGSNGGSNICLSSLGLFAYLVFPAKLHSSYAGQQPGPTRIVSCAVNSS